MICGIPSEIELGVSSSESKISFVEDVFLGDYAQGETQERAFFKQYLSDGISLLLHLVSENARSLLSLVILFLFLFF
jgi:hypothetical protein